MGVKLPNRVQILTESLVVKGKRNDDLPAIKTADAILRSLSKDYRTWYQKTHTTPKIKGSKPLLPTVRKRRLKVFEHK